MGVFMPNYWVEGSPNSTAVYPRQIESQGVTQRMLALRQQDAHHAHSVLEPQGIRAPTTHRKENDDRRSLCAALQPDRLARLRHSLQPRICRAPCSRRSICAVELSRPAQERVVRQSASRLRGEPSSSITPQSKSATELQFGGASLLIILTRAALVANQGGRIRCRTYMIASDISVNDARIYSEDICAALRIFRTLSALPKSNVPTEQGFVDRLMASALRHVAEGARKCGFVVGATSNELHGLSMCSRAIETLAGRTSAPIACGEAARMANSGRGTSAELAIINAAADALGGAA